MRFSELIQIYQQVEATTKRLEMTEHLVKLFRACSPESLPKLVYLSQGMLYPEYLGIELGLGEKLALKSIASASGISERQIEQDWKKLGDLGDAAAEAISKRKQRSLFSSPLDLDRVYSNLERVARAAGEGSQELKLKLLTELLLDASPIEAKYLIRIATGTLRLGVADMTILDALCIAFTGTKETRPIVERAYNLTSDLGELARILAQQGLDGIKSMGISLGKPVRPMLAERVSSIQEILERCEGRCALEYKYDGLRIQAQLWEDQIRLFSRRLEDLTSQFPDVCQALRAALKITPVIVEGECVAVNPDTGELLPFQVISHRRGRKYELQRAMEEYPVRIFLFDCIYCQGQDLTQLPFPERRRILEQILIETDQVKLSKLEYVSSPAQFEHFLESAIADGCEGVIAKSVSENSIYRAGAREYLWIKYKRDYRSELVDTVDLVAVGAFAGKGKRAGTYGALLMAAYDELGGKFKTVCKMGSGFTDQDLAQLPQIFQPYLRSSPHPALETQLQADYWFEPALVLEVLGAEITLSPVHTCARDAIRPGAGLAIRFPRFTGRWRQDKAPQQATTEGELIRMYRAQLKKIQS